MRRGAASLVGPWSRPAGGAEEARVPITAPGDRSAAAPGEASRALPDHATATAPDEGPTAAPAVLCRGLTVRYGGDRALEGVDLEVPARGVQAIVGPSGSGKSSLLMALNRLTDLVPGCRVSGRVRAAGLEALSPETDVRRLRRRVGMVFQKPNPFPVSVRENLAIPLREHGTREAGALEGAIREGLQTVGLWEEVADRLDRPATSLSGGQQQRLCIARALVLRPEVLLMDEPCSALDPLSAGAVEDRILRLGNRYTIVVVTHNLAQARRIADRVALLWRLEGAGRLVEEAPVEAFFGSPRHELTRAYVEGRRG